MSIHQRRLRRVVLYYIKSNKNFKVRNDLKIVKTKELESVFIEIVNKNKSNLIVGCIYRHPSMIASEFIDDYLKPLFDKIDSDKTKVMLMGDFNLDLLQYDNSNDVSNFLETVISNSFFPYISLPTRVTSHSKTVIDNIFLNFYWPNIVSGNLSISISDHLAQFLVIPSIQKQNTKTPLMKRSFKKFSKQNFKCDIENIPWSEIITNNANVETSTSTFINKIENVLDKHAPYKEFTKKQVSNLSKPWVTKDIAKDIIIKNKIHRRFLKCTNTTKKNELFMKFKQYRNKISNLLKVSKKEYYISFFNRNLYDLKNTWKGIKEIINLKDKKSNSQTSLEINSKIETGPTNVANHFNNCFSEIAGKLLNC